MTESEIDALLLEANLIRKFFPHYNVSWKDGKSYPLIEITRDKIPVVRSVHKELNPKSRYFGPYPTGSDLTSLLRFLRRLFPYVSQKHSPGQRCFRSHLGLCPCPDFENYHQTIKQLILFLSGKRQTVQKQLEKAMQDASDNQNYELAERIKNKIEKLAYVTAPRTKPWEYEVNPNLSVDRRSEELNALKKLLNLPNLNKIECYDVSNTSGKLATAAQVTFIDGLPEKSLYRRYRIKRQGKPSDVAMIKEVLTRRQKSSIPLPDLIVIDGGKEHLVDLPVPVIGLAKRLETVFSAEKTIQLPIGHPALALLQRLRDEAHRFSRRYHFLLRQKNLLT